MLDLGMRRFKFPKNLLLIFTILKKTDCATLCARAGVDDPLNSENYRIPTLTEGANNSSPCFVPVEAIAFIKYGNQRRLRQVHSDIFRLIIFHIELPLSQIRHPAWGCNAIR